MDKTTPPPWLQFPSLTEARLRVIAAMIRDVRHEAVLTHQPLLGDDEWVLGVRCYKRICFAISKAAIGEHREWLSVIESDNRELAREAMAPAVLNPELHFVFGIGGLPLRFYKGSADEKTGKSLKRQYPEIHAFQFVMEFVDQPVYDRVLRLAVEIDDAGEVTGVVLVQLDKEGNPHNPWPIQLDTPVSKVVTPFRSTDKEKEIGAPPVGLKRKEEDKKPS